MAVKNEDIHDRRIWTQALRFWYAKTNGKAPTASRPFRQLTIPARLPHWCKVPALTSTMALPTAAVHLILLHTGLSCRIEPCSFQLRLAKSFHSGRADTSSTHGSVTAAGATSTAGHAQGNTDQPGHAAAHGSQQQHAATSSNGQQDFPFEATGSQPAADDVLRGIGSQFDAYHGGLY